MAKKILGLLSGLLVLFVTITLIYPMSRTEKLNEGEEKPKVEQKVKKKTKEPDLPDVKRSDADLLLVNLEHSTTSDGVKLAKLKNGYFVAERVYDPYYDMEEAAKKDGFSLVIISGFRSVDDQTKVYEDAIALHKSEGMSDEEAKKKTEDYITIPGTSEHHTGLAMDVVDQKWYDTGQGLEEEFCNTPAGKWIDENAHLYGFIVRYPKDKEKITKINYEPWHLRYVGKENAKYIYEHHLVLEEYIELLEKAGK